MAPLTLMAVHAHPDDEVLLTGGVLALYSSQGIETVVVTCTDGEQGDGPGGVKPGEPGHDPAAVVATRAAELERSCALLGVGHLERLDYRDSGMDGWSANADPGVFANVTVAEAAGRLRALMERYRPQVVVTYDENGGYGHPDHIQAHRITLAAIDGLDWRPKLYYAAIPRSAFAGFRQRLAEAGVSMEDLDLPDSEEGQDPPFGVPDEAIDAVVDVSGFAEAKHQALLAHASQTDNSFFSRLPVAAFSAAFSREHFIRVDGEGAGPATRSGSTPESDLFSDLRSAG